MEEFLMKASAAGDIEATFELDKFYIERGKVEEGENLIETAAAIFELVKLLLLFKKLHHGANFI